MDDLGDFKSAHFAHVRCADDGCRCVVLKSGEREGGLGARLHLETFALQRVAEPLGEIDVAVDQENFGSAARGDHGWASCAGARSGTGAASAGVGPGVRAARLSTSITSPSWESHPATCGMSVSPAGIISAKINSQSPVTGRAIHSTCAT